jgi:hypothetical protein
MFPIKMEKFFLYLTIMPWKYTEYMEIKLPIFFASPEVIDYIHTPFHLSIQKSVPVPTG